MAEITFRGNPIHTVGDAPRGRLAGPGVHPHRHGPLATSPSATSPARTSCSTSSPASTPRCARAACARSTSGPPPSRAPRCSTSPPTCPFALGRFCGAEGIENVQSASMFRSDFGDSYGVTIAEGPLAGLMSRAVVVVDGDGVVTYTEQVPEIGQEPDYDVALAASSRVRPTAPCRSSLREVLDPEPGDVARRVCRCRGRRAAWKPRPGSGRAATIEEVEASGPAGPGRSPGSRPARSGGPWPQNLSHELPATVVVNGAEGEPGSFKDRAIARAQPVPGARGRAHRRRTPSAPTG